MQFKEEGPKEYVDIATHRVENIGDRELLAIIFEPK